MNLCVRACQFGRVPKLVFATLGPELRRQFQRTISAPFPMKLHSQTGFCAAYMYPTPKHVRALNKIESGIYFVQRFAFSEVAVSYDKLASRR